MQTTVAVTDDRSGWNVRYEVKAVFLLALGYGLVGLDRNIIYPLFPVIAKELGMNYQDLGLISAVLSLCWGLASILTGRLSDRIGCKRVIVPAVIVFSLLVGGSGLAAGMLSMVLLRGLMGIAEGAYVPASIVATVEASKPSRIGLNVGLQQMSAPLVGLGLGPLIAIAMLKVVPNWHWIFAIVAVPGFVIAALLAKSLRADAPAGPANAAQSSSWFDVLRYRNVISGTLLMLCALSGLVVLSAFLPSYLTDHLRLSMDSMSLVLSALGVGCCLGVVVLPALSDRFGCKPVIVTALVFEVIGLWLVTQTGAEPMKLFILLAFVTFLMAGVIGITVGPFASESVPPELGATATGMIVGLGEIIGGAVAPAVTGGIAQHAGISVILQIALGSAVLGLLIAAFGAREPTHDFAARRTEAG